MWGVYESFHKPEGAFNIGWWTGKGPNTGYALQIYMKYSANQGRISSFVVGGTGSE